MDDFFDSTTRKISFSQKENSFLLSIITFYFFQLIRFCLKCQTEIQFRNWPLTRQSFVQQARAVGETLLMMFPLATVSNDRKNFLFFLSENFFSNLQDMNEMATKLADTRRLIQRVQTILFVISRYVFLGNQTPSIYQV